MEIIMGQKQWQEYSVSLKDVLGLTSSPVAIRCTQQKPPEGQKKRARICKVIFSAAKGEKASVNKDNNACIGAAWYLGLSKADDVELREMVKKYIVEGEKLFSSQKTADHFFEQIGGVSDKSDCCYFLEPMESSEEEPQIVIFICDAEQACRLFALVTFSEGNAPRIQIGGSTCRMAITYPLLSQEVNLSFLDYSSRQHCKVENDKLLVTIPYKKIPQIVANIEVCSGGKAQIEFPQEFRAFLQKRAAKK